MTFEEMTKRWDAMALASKRENDKKVFAVRYADWWWSEGTYVRAQELVGRDGNVVCAQFYRPPPGKASKSELPKLSFPAPVLPVLEWA